MLRFVTLLCSYSTTLLTSSLAMSLIAAWELHFLFWVVCSPFWLGLSNVVWSILDRKSLGCGHRKSAVWVWKCSWSLCHNLHGVWSKRKKVWLLFFVFPNVALHVHEITFCFFAFILSTFFNTPFILKTCNRWERWLSQNLELPQWPLPEDTETRCGRLSQL